MGRKERVRRLKREKSRKGREGGRERERESEGGQKGRRKGRREGKNDYLCQMPSVERRRKALLASQGKSLCLQFLLWSFHPECKRRQFQFTTSNNRASCTANEK